MKIETGKMGRKLLLLMLAMPGAYSAQAAENYVMLVYSDRAQGSAIVQDKLDEAISALQPDARRNRNFAEQVSLCVALTRTRQFELATEYCDMSVAQAGREQRRIRRSNNSPGHAARLSAAPKVIALTNRGVLHAVAGEPEEARILFEMAQEAELMEEFALHNLARLNAPTDGGDS